MCVNIYDVRLEDTVPACGMNWPPEISHITTLLGVRLDLSSQGVLATHADQTPFVYLEI